MSDIGKPRGRPRKAKEKTWTGRYPKVYSLTWKSRFLIRFDPKLVDNWKSVEKTQYELEEPNMLDSFNNLRHAIKTHSVLGRFERPYYFDGILQRTLLNPFLFTEYSDEDEFNQVCEQVVELIKENVKPEFVEGYRSALENSVTRLERIISRHKLMISKVNSIENWDSTLTRYHLSPSR